MTKEIVIEDLRGKGMTAEITDVERQFETYVNFADKAGYPSAARDRRGRYLKERINETFKVLARGNHGSPFYDGVTIYVIESEDGERFLVGDGGLKIHEPIAHESKLTDMGYAELIRYTDEVNRALRRKVYAEAYEQGRIDGRLDALKEEPTPTDAIYEAYNEVYGEGFGEKLTEITQDMAQNKRDEIVDKAKQFVKETTERTSFTTYEFIVNKTKRTVVVLRRNIHGKVLVRGKATAHPDECFNVHIGKAIALRRAMFMDVPDEFLNVPQPSEVRVGDVVKFPNKRVASIEVNNKETREIVDVETGKEYSAESLDLVKIIDDSREEVSEQ